MVSNILYSYIKVYIRKFMGNMITNAYNISHDPCYYTEIYMDISE